MVRRVVIMMFRKLKKYQYLLFLIYSYIIKLTEYYLHSTFKLLYLQGFIFTRTDPTFLLHYSSEYLLFIRSKTMRNFTVASFNLSISHLIYFYNWFDPSWQDFNFKFLHDVHNVVLLLPLVSLNASLVYLTGSALLKGINLAPANEVFHPWLGDSLKR